MEKGIFKLYNNKENKAIYLYFHFYQPYFQIYAKISGD